MNKNVSFNMYIYMIIIIRWQSDGLRYDSEAIADKDDELIEQSNRIAVAKPIE